MYNSSIAKAEQTQSSTPSGIGKETIGQTRPKIFVFDYNDVILHPNNPSLRGQGNSMLRNPGISIATHFKPNTELLAFIKEHILPSGVEVRIFSTHLDLPEAPEVIREVFDGKVALVKELGVDSKRNPEAYTKLVEKLGADPKEVVFVDNEQANVDAARQAGLHAIRFPFELSIEEANADVIKQLRALLDEKS